MSSGVPPTTPPQYSPNILHKLTMAGNRCAGPLTTSSPTASSSCTKTLSSTRARSTVLCPPSWPTTSVAVSVGRAPHGEARLPQVSRMSPPLPAPTRYTSSTAACSPSLIQVPSLIFYGSAGCSLRENNPSGRRLVRGLRLLTSRWTLTSTFWCLSSTRHHSRESASFLCTVYGVRGGTVQTPISGCELTLTVWGGAVALMSDCLFYTLSALRA